MIKNNRLLYSCAVALSLSASVSAQSSRYEARLDSVKQTGFYKIVLDGEVAAASQLYFNDLRIFSGEKNYVPYIISKVPQVSSESVFTEFLIVQKTKDTAGNTVIVIGNQAGKPISNLWLFIKNTAVTRGASLSGSNDQRDWFVIKEDIYLEPFLNPETETYQPVLSFPVSNYKYLRLVIDNSKRDPLNILKAGVYDNFTTVAETYTTNPGTSFKQKDSSDKRSYIFITQSKPYPAEQMQLAVTAPKFFERTAHLYKLNDSTTDVVEDLGSFNISSKAALEFHIRKLVKANRLLLVIENADNSPLNISKLDLSHQYSTMYSYLEKGSSYRLQFGDAQAERPVYDLENFKDSIPAFAPLLNYATAIPTGTKPVEEKPVQKNKTLVWSAIIAAIAILSFFTFRLVKDMKQKP